MKLFFYACSLGSTLSNIFNVTFLAIEMEEKCQNCGELLEDSLLTYCSSKCQFENYLKSQAGIYADRDQ